jgi:hypothetical protein
LTIPFRTRFPLLALDGGWQTCRKQTIRTRRPQPAQDTAIGQLRSDVTGTRGT